MLSAFTGQPADFPGKIRSNLLQRIENSFAFQVLLAGTIEPGAVLRGSRGGWIKGGVRPAKEN